MNHCMSDTQLKVDKTGSRVQRMFGEIAPKYDRMNRVLSMNIDRRWRKKTVRIVSPVGDTPILDVCTGTADLAFAWCKRVKGNVDVVGTDFCREMLEIGNQKKQRHKFGNRLELLEADTLHLPFDNETFQIVSVGFGLRNVQDTDAGLREMTRVCKRGGKVAVLEFSHPQWQPFKSMYGFYMRRILPGIGRTSAKYSEDAYKYLPDSVLEFPSGSALVERMESAGLTDVKMHSFTLGVVTLYVGTRKDEDADG